MKDYKKNYTENTCYYYKEIPDNEEYSILHKIPTVNGNKNIYLNNDLIKSTVSSLIHEYESQSLICAITIDQKDYVLEIESIDCFEIKEFSNKYVLLDDGDSKLNLLKK